MRGNPEGPEDLSVRRSLSLSCARALSLPTQRIRPIISTRARPPWPTFPWPSSRSRAPPPRRWSGNSREASAHVQVQRKYGWEPSNWVCGSRGAAAHACAPSWAFDRASFDAHAGPLAAALMRFQCASSSEASSEELAHWKQLTREHAGLGLNV